MCSEAIQLATISRVFILIFRVFWSSGLHPSLPLRPFSRHALSSHAAPLPLSDAAPLLHSCLVLCRIRHVWLCLTVSAVSPVSTSLSRVLVAGARMRPALTVEAINASALLSLFSSRAPLRSSPSAQACCSA
eukprot:2954047-Pleurochrysis_carterae.AAC.1